MTSRNLAATAALVALMGCSNHYEEPAMEITADEVPPVEAPQPFYSASSSPSYPCTVDCSGHEAGYQWAEENSIDDPSDCGGNSNSFIEGCEAYAEEQSEEPAEGQSEEE